jgi:hypothetical protein
MRSTQDRGWWSAPTSTDEAHARAAGRRRYNGVRQAQAQLRRALVLHLVIDYGGLHRGVQAKIARDLGVSEATISRDLRGILAPTKRARCPLCGCGGHLDTTLRLEGPEPPSGLLDDLDSLKRELLDGLDQAPTIDLDSLLTPTDDLDDLIGLSGLDDLEEQQ